MKRNKDLGFFEQKLAKNLKFYRESNQYSIEIIARVFSVKPSTVKAWEEGKKVPSLSTVIRLSTLYKVPIDSLINLKNFGRTVTAQEPLKEGEMTVAEKELIFKYRKSGELWQGVILFTADLGLDKNDKEKEEFRVLSNLKL